MFEVIEDFIYLNKGDDGECYIEIYHDDGTKYELQGNDYLEVTVRSLPDDSSPVLYSFTSFSKTLKFKHEFTEQIPVGTYSMDVQLHQDVGDPTGRLEIHTVYPDLTYHNMKRGKIYNWKNFVVDAEVTYPAP